MYFYLSNFFEDNILISFSIGTEVTCSYHEPMQKQVGHGLACMAEGIYDGCAIRSLKAIVFSRRMRERHRSWVCRSPANYAKAEIASMCNVCATVAVILEESMKIIMNTTPF